jgi:hypothetical protein
MSPRRAKQIVYGVIYFAILLLVVTGIHFLFFRSPASCFDNIQNQGEQGVDCGGPCAKVCIPSTIQPISVLGTVHVFSPTTGHVTVLAQLENANSDFGASSFNYVVTLYGLDDMTVVGTLAGSSFTYADETKYIVLPNEPVPMQIGRADIAIGNVQWVPADRMGLVPLFTFTNIMPSSGKGYVTIGGDITDRDISSFSSVTLVAIFKNAAGSPIGASATELDSISPGTAQAFSVSYPALPNENISATELKAYAIRQ